MRAFAWGKMLYNVASNMLHSHGEKFAQRGDKADSSEYCSERTDTLQPLVAETPPVEQ